MINNIGSERKQELVIMSSILYLAKVSKKSQVSQRNLLNKWFQDSIKSYFMEQVAFPFLAQYLQMKNSDELKVFINSIRISKIKPKYMEIVEQYFYYLNKFNLKDAFVQKLNSIILNPIDITQLSSLISYNTSKAVRKQFVCLLILRFYQFQEKQEFTSFYDLWNFCFPQEYQKKKKLSKYDTQVEKKIERCPNKIVIKLPSQLNQSNNYNSLFYPLQQDHINKESSSLTSSPVENNIQKSQDQHQQKVQENQINTNNFQQQYIGSGILEEDDDEEEEEYIFLSNHTSYQENYFCKKQEGNYSQFNNGYKCIQVKQQENQFELFGAKLEENHFQHLNQNYYLSTLDSTSQNFYKINTSQHAIQIKQEDLIQPNSQ